MIILKISVIISRHELFLILNFCISFVIDELAGDVSLFNELIKSAIVSLVLMKYYFTLGKVKIVKSSFLVFSLLFGQSSNLLFKFIFYFFNWKIYFDRGSVDSFHYLPECKSVSAKIII